VQRTRRDLRADEDEGQGEGEAAEAKSNHHALGRVLGERERRHGEAPDALDESHGREHGDLGGRAGAHEKSAHCPGTRPVIRLP
jgi:hypothetical protein